MRTSMTVLAILMLVLLFAPDSTSVRASSDVTIKTRRTFGARLHDAVETNTVYLKGTRQRRDELIEWPATSQPPHLSSHISLCDEHRMLIVDSFKRTYAYEPIVDYHATLSARVASAALSPQRPVQQTGAVVTVTFDAVDTGERRQVGRYTARHVISSRKTEPGPGASATADLEELDGWYVDLPSIDCSEHDSRTQVSFLMAGKPGDPEDRYEFKQLHSAKRGYPIEETRRSTQNGAQVVTDRSELIEIADTPLDDALFTPPEGYRPALPLALGGHDFTKPDTFINRLQSYGEAITYWWGRLFS